jgi:hypothetical protein
MMDKPLNTEYEQLVQDGVGSSHSECRTAMYRQIPSEREREILHRLSAQYEEKTLVTYHSGRFLQLCASREETVNRPHVHFRPTDVHIRHAEELVS